MHLHMFLVLLLLCPSPHSVGGRSHGGVDVKCSDGSAVYAPFDGKLVGRIRPYGNKNKIDDGFKLIGNGNSYSINKAHCL